jgi:hypothetical protein
MRTALAALTLGLTLAGTGLVSCAGSGGPPLSPEPRPSGTPVFASDEEALAAAEEAYQRYLDVSNKVGQDGWTDAKLFTEVSRGPALEGDLTAASDLQKNGYRQVGELTFDSLALQQYRANSPGQVLISVYLCLDVTEVDVIDTSGHSVVGVERPERQPLEVDIDDRENELKVSRSEPWSGTSFC